MFWNCSGTLLKWSVAPSRMMSSDWIVSQPVSSVQSARTSTFSPSHAAATENVSGSSIVVVTGPFANRALRRRADRGQAAGQRDRRHAREVTVPPTSCVTFER